MTSGRIDKPSTYTRPDFRTTRLSAATGAETGVQGGAGSGSPDLRLSDRTVPEPVWPAVTGCYLAQFFPTPCDLGPMGRLTRAHVISQQTIKREHQLANPRSPRFDFVPSPLTGTDLRELLDDPRNWRPACWRHHSHVDGPWGAFPIPDSTRDFAAQYGLELRGAG